MNKLISNSLEILFSLFIVGGLLFIAFYVKPTATVAKFEPTLFGFRDNYYSIASPLADGRVIWAVGNKGKIIRSDDAGITWRIQESPTTSHLQGIATWDEKTAIVAGDLASVLITDNAGESWTKVDIPTYQFGDQLLQLYIDHNKQEAWISGTMGSVYKSADRGKTWQLTHDEEDVAWNDIEVDRRGQVWVAGEFGRLQRSADDGQTWEEVEVPASGSSLMAITFADEDHGVAVGLSGIVVRTENGGDSWSVVEDVTDAHLFDINWDGQQYVAVGNNGILAYGSLEGSEWQIKKIHPDNSGWYTNIIPVGKSYFIAGVNMGVLNGTDWKVFQ
jgi:photosystem II stability/assembly factor-like uncharacterized protein